MQSNETPAWLKDLKERQKMPPKVAPKPTTGEADVQTTPGWVKAIENKRLRPHKLAHDVGAGAPCLTCKDACPGLDLHFWRKSCRNCKCGKEKHDVVEDQEYQQFEILLGMGHKKTLKLSYQLNVEEESLVPGTPEKTVNFDWLPPGIAPEVAKRYMMGLPESQRPISGTEGAQRRREQLERQVPLHDVDPSQCHELTNEEISGLENYRQQLKDAAVGQGRVATLAAMLRELRLPYALPASELAASVPAAPLHAQHAARPQPLNNNNEESFPPPPSPETLSDLQSPEFPSPPPPLPNSMPPNFLHRPSDFLQRPSAFLPKPYRPPGHPDSADVNHNPTITADVNRNDPSNVDPQQELFNKMQAQQRIQGGSLDRTHLGLDFPSPPSVLNESIKSPDCEGSSVKNQPVRATTYDNNNVEGELPGELAGLHLTDPEGSIAVCRQCSLPAAPGDVVVTADRAGPGVFWHPSCFICSTCQELLVDLIYFYKGDKLFCGRHFAEEVNIPRCAACDELIFTKEYTLAEEQFFHVRHFCCFECDTALAGMNYISRDGHPWCIPCYDIKYPRLCNTCQRNIKPQEKSLNWQELHWHATPECFRCVTCLCSLIDSKFAVRDQQSFCSKKCQEAYLSQKPTTL